MAAHAACIGRSTSALRSILSHCTKGCQIATQASDNTGSWCSRREGNCGSTHSISSSFICPLPAEWHLYCSVHHSRWGRVVEKKSDKRERWEKNQLPSVLLSQETEKWASSVQVVGEWYASVNVVWTRPNGSLRWVYDPNQLAQNHTSQTRHWRFWERQKGASYFEYRGLLS